jgi:hypothetical protein
MTSNISYRHSGEFCTEFLGRSKDFRITHAAVVANQADRVFNIPFMLFSHYTDYGVGERHSDPRRGGDFSVYQHD